MSHQSRTFTHGCINNAIDEMWDSLLEELPPANIILSSIQKDLPKHTKVEIEDNIIYLQNEDIYSLQESIQFLSLVFPELDFVIQK